MKTRLICRSLSHLLNILKVGPYFSDVIIDWSESTSLKIRYHHYWRISELFFRPCVNEIWVLTTIRFKILYCSCIVVCACNVHAAVTKYCSNHRVISWKERLFLKYTNQFTKKGKFINDIFPRGYTCFKNILKKISVLTPTFLTFLKSLLYSWRHNIKDVKFKGIHCLKIFK